MNHDELMMKIKKKLNRIHEVAPKGSQIVYFDYPIHFNIGDLLIYHGTLNFFNESNYKILHVCSDKIAENFNFPKLESNVIIMLHGGGNFGDLYEKHQKFREAVVSFYKKNKIIILPQSIKFNSNEILIESADLFSKHNNVHIYCRDELSASIAKNFSKNVYLMPDMAHSLWKNTIFNIKQPRNKSINKKNYFLYQKRQDKENNTLKVSEVFKNYQIYDWYDNILIFAKLASSILSRIEKIALNERIHSFNEKIWRYMAYKSIRHSAQIINESAYFVTDRLHGHILAMLLSKEHSALDNNYKKNSMYISTWTKNSDLIYEA